MIKDIDIDRLREILPTFNSDKIMASATATRNGSIIWFNIWIPDGYVTYRVNTTGVRKGLHTQLIMSMGLLLSGDDRVVFISDCDNAEEHF